MKQLTKHLTRISPFLMHRWSHEKGATATEYSILLGFIAIVIVAGVGLFGTSLNGLFNALSSGIKTALGIP